MEEVVKEVEKMPMGEIVKRMISLSLGCHEDLSSLGERGSPYHSVEELRRGIRERYRAELKPYEEELNRRDIK